MFGCALKDIELRENVLGSSISISLMELKQSQSRESLIIGYLLRNVELVSLRVQHFQNISNGFQVLILCSVELDRDVFHNTKTSDNHLTAISLLDEALMESNHGSFLPLRVSLNALSQSTTRNQTVHELGRCWICLSQILLGLYVPNIPIDPHQIALTRISFRKSRENWIRSLIHLFTCWERISSGRQSNILVQVLEDRLKNVYKSTDTDAVTSDVGRESDSSLLQTFWSEIRNFLSGVLPPERLEKFVHAATERTGDVLLLSHELLLQDSISTFLQRMETTYGPLEDLMRAIELAMMQLQFGLRTLRHSYILGSPSSPSPRLSQIFHFPSIQANVSMMAVGCQEPTSPEFSSEDALLLQLATLGYCPSIDDRRIRIRNLYEVIPSTWGADLETKAKEAKQAESIYKSKETRHDAVDDDHDDKVLELFPRFDEDEQEAHAVSTTARMTGHAFGSSTFSENPPGHPFSALRPRKITLAEGYRYSLAHVASTDCLRLAKRTAVVIAEQR